MRPVARKSSPQIALPIARKARASGVATPAHAPADTRNESPIANIFQHVAVRREHDVLAPIAGVGELVVGAAAVHPFLAVARVMVRQRKMRRTEPERLAHGDALAVERVGDAAHRRLGALLVNVPAREVLERRGIHDDERRVDDRPRIHQRARQRIAAGLDDARECAADDGERVLAQPQRQHAGRQPLGTHRDRDLERTMLAREPWQRAGLGERDVGAVAGRARGLRENHRAESARRQKHHLPVGKMRSHRTRDIGLRRRRHGADDEFGAAHGLGNVRRDERGPRLVPAAKILDDDRPARRPMRRDRIAIAPPQAHLVARQRKIPGRGERPVSAAEDSNAHDGSVREFATASVCACAGRACAAATH